MWVSLPLSRSLPLSLSIYIYVYISVARGEGLVAPAVTSVSTPLCSYVLLFQALQQESCKRVHGLEAKPPHKWHACGT